MLESIASSSALSRLVSSISRPSESAIEFSACAERADLACASRTMRGLRSPCAIASAKLGQLDDGNRVTSREEVAE